MKAYVPFIYDNISLNSSYNEQCLKKRL